ncbi:NAD+ synthase [Anaerosphaera aminiphila DSM 21120]|uniref:NH(3)-dependent NAD(+) synthetase n=1 Tax=Anaerosphaera aminiphila DSM 21120 TaxID=1120995 RepID=A0A1M5PCQ1_9FIRM|nr:NAD(+) synthase [Anaerosphaera aminiphila]SHG99581.1 NAD+ synthase [Anaerosphaera aminiphila DSM 21120]
MEFEPVVNWLREIVKKSNAKGLVFGLSGGIDSAVIAGLAKKAFPNDSLGVIMPCESADEDEEDAILVADRLNLEVEKVDLTNTYRTLLKDSFISDNKMAKSNIKPRLRMTTLYYYAQDRGYLVCGSSNASEFYIGYYTKNGDSGVDILPLVSFLKEEVFEMARELNIPEKIIDKKPSAGLWENQTDEMEMGFTYEELDAHIRGEKIDSDIAKKIEHMHEVSEHKRSFAAMYIK